MTEQKYYLYKITNKVNGKLYIGVTQNPTDRFKQHAKAKDSNRGSAIHRSIEKHGWENFSTDLLCVGSRKYIYDLELAAIESYGSHVSTGMGYNVCLGGVGVKTTDWSKYDHLLPFKSNIELAKIIGCSSCTVSSRRVSLGILSTRAYSAAETRRLSTEALTLAIKYGYSVKEAADKYGLAASELAKELKKQDLEDLYKEARETHKNIQLDKAVSYLLSHYDSLGLVAENFNIGKLRLTDTLKARGLLKEYQRRLKNKPAKLRKVWREVDPMLTNNSDKEISEEVGLTPYEVYSRRKLLGLIPYIKP